jgi:hypothetical protein
MVAAEGWHRTNGVAIQGRRCLQGLSGIVVDSLAPILMVAHEQAWNRSRRADRRKPGAWELRIHWVLVDNKSVAEIGKRHLLPGAASILGYWRRRE